jgi:alkanesulfonate monooxygenase SsuD/methylene tetrahydromethanopterin reductase-like flavin-dependent oxidoreductase (luciferase family)
MDYGIALATHAESYRIVKRAEELGFARAWFFDTHLLNAELFVGMAAAAMVTSKIRLGTGVLIPTNRIAPVAASALASLNKLAPGRIDFGVSTGFTGRRTMGVGRVKLADMKEYIRVVQGLLGGDIVEWEFEGKRRKMAFLNPEIGAINIDDPIPLWVSAIGPRARKLVAEIGAGWICPASSGQATVAAMGEMKSLWREAGRDGAAFRASAEVGGCVLKEGEAYDSPRARAQAGPSAVMLLHDFVERDQFGTTHGPIPPPLAAPLDKYRKHYQKFTPADARYIANHRGHLMFLKPEDEDVCTADLIRNFSWTATKPELVERIRALKDAGFGNFVVQIRHAEPGMLEDWADVFAGV